MPKRSIPLIHRLGPPAALLGRRLTATGLGPRLIRPARSRLASGTDPVARDCPQWLAFGGSGESDGGLWAPLLLAALLAAGCYQPPVYRMVLPQVSAGNYFVGPDLEVGFDFAHERVEISLSNTGDGDLLVDWAQTSLVRPDGVATPLVPDAVSTVQTLPSGSRSTMQLVPSQWLRPPPTLWHRRANLQYRLVPAAVFLRCVPMLRVALPVKRFLGERVLSEVLMFTFQVSPADGSPAPAGGGDDLPF